MPIYQRLFGDRDPVAEPGTDTGTPGDWWTTMAGAPALLDHMVAGFALFNSPERALDPRLRELALTRTGFAAGSKFVFSQHCKAARNAGMTEAQLAAIPVWHNADVYEPSERAVLAFTDQLVFADGRVQDMTFDALAEHLDNEAILELTYVVCSYRMHATMSRALRLEYDDVDERIVEVAAPDDAVDVMSQISMTDEPS